MKYEILPAEKFDLLWNEDYYKTLKKFDKRKVAKHIRKDHEAIVSFMYCDVCKAHVFMDDGCYVVVISGGTYEDKDGTEKTFYHPTFYIFPEALEVLKTLNSKL